MKKLILLVFSLFFIFPLVAFAFKDSFGHLNEEAIDYLEENDVVQGYSDGIYRPDNQINRAEFLKIILESLDVKLDSGGYCFPDVQSDWYALYVCKAKSLGIISGYSGGYFRPGNNINLAESLKIVLEAYDASLNYSYSEWYEPYYHFMVDNKLLAHVNTSISHKITRGEMAQIIYNLDNFYEQVVTPPVKSEVSYCYLDHALKVGSYREEFNTDLKDIESIGVIDNEKCRDITLAKGYRFSKYYFSTPDFAILCTESCSIDDESFFEASFEGHILGVDTLREKVGYLPKKKMEFHLGKDGDCFVDRYGDHPTGYAASFDGHSLLCNSNYYWYLESQGTAWERNLDYEKKLESQTLTIHEPIHRIFSDYSAEGFSTPGYKIQESFCKAVSLNAVGTINGYGDNFLSGISSLTDPPEEDNINIYNFLIYSLNQRFGFNEDENTLDFFSLYKQREDIATEGNLKVKQILDEVLGTDTTASFNDVGIYFE